MSSPEEIKPSVEQSAEHFESAAERSQELQKQVEQTVELSPRDAEQRAEAAQAKAIEAATNAEASKIEKKVHHPTTTRRGPMNKKQQNANFKRTIKQVQTELSPASRTFSRFIHARAVEKTSETIGATIARPNAILAGAVMAFILTLAVYVTAKIVGYQLSGFETIGAFIVGWVLGILYDYLRVVVTGKSS